MSVLTHSLNQYLPSDWIHHIMTNDCSYLSQFDKSNCDEVKRDEALIRTDCSALRCFFISTFLKRGHLMIVHLFLTLHTGIALNWGPLQCLQFMNFNDKRSYGIARPNFNKSQWFKSFQRYWSLSDRSILQHLPHQTQTHQRWATLMGDHTIQGEAFSFAIGQTAGNVITFLS